MSEDQNEGYTCPLCDNKDEFSILGYAWFPIDGQGRTRSEEYRDGPYWEDETALKCDRPDCRHTTQVDYFSGDITHSFGAAVGWEKTYLLTQHFDPGQALRIKKLGEAGRLKLYIAEGRYFEMPLDKPGVITHEWDGQSDRDSHLLVRLDGYEDAFWGVAIMKDYWKEYAVNLILQRGHLLWEYISKSRTLFDITQLMREANFTDAPSNALRDQCGLWDVLQFRNLPASERVKIASAYLAGEWIHVDAFEGLLKLNNLWEDANDPLYPYIRTKLFMIQREGAYTFIDGNFKTSAAESAQLINRARELAEDLERSYT